MKYLLTIPAIASMCLLSACATNRVVSGQVVHTKSKKPAEGVNVYYKYSGLTYPSFCVYFVIPMVIPYKEKVITDNQGRFKIETKNKRHLDIQPILIDQKDDVIVVNLTDTLKTSSSDGSPNVTVHDSMYFTGHEKDLFRSYNIDGNKIYYKSIKNK